MSAGARLPSQVGSLCLGLSGARGACDGFDEGPELFAIEGRQSAGELESAVAVVAPSQVLGAAGVALLAFEKLAFGGLGDLGGDDLEQMPGECSQLPRAVVRRTRPWWPRRLRDDRVEVDGQVVQHVDHGERLVGGDVTVGHRRGQPSEPVVQGSGECDVTMGCRQACRRWRAARPPYRDRSGCRDVAFVDRAEHAQLQPGQ